MSGIFTFTKQFQIALKYPDGKTEKDITRIFYDTDELSMRVEFNDGSTVKGMMTTSVTSSETLWSK